MTFHYITSHYNELLTFRGCTALPSALENSAKLVGRCLNVPGESTVGEREKAVFGVLGNSSRSADVVDDRCRESRLLDWPDGIAYDGVRAAAPMSREALAFDSIAVLNPRE